MSTQHALAPFVEPTLQPGFGPGEPSLYRCSCGCKSCSSGAPRASASLSEILGHIEPEVEAHNAWIWSGIGRRA